MPKILLCFFIFCVSAWARNFVIADENLKLCKSDERCKNILLHYANFMNQIQEKDFMLKLELINDYINSILPRYDNFYKPNVDIWSTRGEFLRSAGGDCEEYAITKKESIKDLGLKNRQCLLIVKEKKTSRYHMVLAVWKNLKSEPLILDNLSFRVLPLSARYDLEPSYCLTSGKYYKIAKDGINLKELNIRMTSYEALLKKEKKEKFWKN
ncbi:MAG: transglutaminase-like cysteine peptidase [Campylobacter sp.]|nr:transglutaminase-like cysteine peptidase [Campylobacter sp.]